MLVNCTAYILSVVFSCAMFCRVTFIIYAYWVAIVITLLGVFALIIWLVVNLLGISKRQKANEFQLAMWRDASEGVSPILNDNL